MGIKERKERERLVIRDAILSAAVNIATHEGWQAVTIRKMAERIEYSPPMIYEHFENKEAVLMELSKEGFAMLRERLYDASMTTTDSRIQLHRMATAYWDFAWSHTELYQVMHGLAGIPFGTMEGAMEAKEVFSLVRESVIALFQEMGFHPQDIDLEVDLLWASLHGLIVLTMDGRIAGGPGRGAQMVAASIQHFLAAWGDES